MRKATRIAILVLVVLGLGLVRPGPADAYRTTFCEDTGFPREFGVAESPSRLFFVGTEHSTSSDVPGVIIGARLCFEVNNGPTNVIGYDIGFGVWESSVQPGPGLVVVLDVCGIPTETTCTRQLQPTGVEVDPGDAPVVTLPSTSCDVTVGPFCIGDPTVEVGKSGGTTLIVVVNGTQVPLNLGYRCVSLPGTPCPTP